LVEALAADPALSAVADAERFLETMLDAARRCARLFAEPRSCSTRTTPAKDAIAGALLDVNDLNRHGADEGVNSSTVLVIDDDPDSREILMRYLQRKGHRALTARNGEDGLAMLRALAFDAILLDLDLPHLNGYGVLQQLKSDPVFAAIPVVIVSGFNERETVAHCLEQGADDFIAKPFDPVLLLSRLRASIEKKRLLDREHESHERLRREEERSRSLLLNILPAAVARRLDYGQTMIADHFQDVSVLFCDLAGFSRYSSSVAPTELVKQLNLLFEAFDELAVTHGVEKIKTVGDAYLAVAGLPEPCSDHALRACRLGLDMIRAAAAVRATGNLPLGVRVGVHSGPVTAGVIGKLKFAYDIWGDTVNVASRMESTGVIGTVQITQATRDKLGEQLLCEPRETAIEIKGKGLMQTWLLRPVSG
ncbi:MAG: adenylate/guanylate cyclase domain-containing response regulator, partial [Gammaproteobacteria bacterium]|nr:adenylate/guanylate cyclase domain-containing response regulator [Gammaproteobacteria bacterium]